MLSSQWCLLEFQVRHCSRFIFNIGTEGLWLGLALGYIINSLFFIVLIFFCFDWIKISDETYEKLQIAKIEK